MVGVVLKNGGGFGAAAAMSKIAKTRKNIAMATFLLGLLIMFHTYANALIIGQSMRPVTDLYLISREKLAFLVDSTSAPIASVSPVSSWIGYEMSLIDSILDYLVDQGEDISCYDQSSFVIFVKTIPTRYYPWGVLFIQCMCIVVEREFGPMLFAERRAKSGRGVAPPSDDQIGELDQALNPSPDDPLKWWMAFWPIVAVFTLTVFFLIYTGAQNAKAAGAARDIHNMFGYSESNLSLLYASFLASMLAFLMSRLIGYTKDGKVFPTVFTRWFSTEKVKPYLHFSESLWAWIEGMKGILSSMIILVLAWAVGASIQHANTGTFISSAAADGVNPKAFPAMCFCISGILSGITGTSWGTMAIMFPLVLPAAHFAAPCNRTIFYGTIASILSGAIFGDHISPLSDTTIISCVSTKCDVWAHVITQAPYAFLAGGIGVSCCDVGPDGPTSSLQSLTIACLHRHKLPAAMPHICSQPNLLLSSLPTLFSDAQLLLAIDFNTIFIYTDYVGRHCCWIWVVSRGSWYLPCDSWLRCSSVSLNTGRISNEYSMPFSYSYAMCISTCKQQVLHLCSSRW